MVRDLCISHGLELEFGVIVGDSAPDRELSIKLGWRFIHAKYEENDVGAAILDALDCIRDYYPNTSPG